MAEGKLTEYLLPVVAIGGAVLAVTQLAQGITPPEPGESTSEITNVTFSATAPLAAVAEITNVTFSATPPTTTKASILSIDVQTSAGQSIYQVKLGDNFTIYPVVDSDVGGMFWVGYSLIHTSGKTYDLSPKFVNSSYGGRVAVPHGFTIPTNAPTGYYDVVVATWQNYNTNTGLMDGLIDKKTVTNRLGVI